MIMLGCHDYAGMPWLCWDAAEEQTIVNCIRKAEISPDAQTDTVNEEEDPFQKIEVENDPIADL